MFKTLNKLLSLIGLMVVVGAVVSNSVNAANLPTVTTVEQRLEAEINKMITAGHLRTSYTYGPDFRYARNRVGTSPNYITVQEFDDLFHNPAETLYTLAIAYPYVGPSVQAQLLTYMANEYSTYQPYRYDHMGTAGTHREWNEVPSEVVGTYRSSYGINSSSPTTLTGFAGWSFHPFNFYALYKYAQVAGNASSILTSLTQYGHSMPAALPADSVLSVRPHVLNSYIAGYYGYQGLLELAGQPRNATIDTYLASALSKRVSFLPADTAAVRAISPYESGGFLYLVPELGDYLYSNALAAVTTSVNSQSLATPYWMLPNVDESFRLNDSFYAEGTLTPMYDESSLFLAKAYALKQSRTELEKYLHYSTLYRGDLFYIQNLVATIQSGAGSSDPSLISISPSTGQNTTSVNFTLTGINFEAGATVKLAGGSLPNINATSVNVASSSSITGTFSLVGQTAAVYNVVYTAPDTTTASLINAFTITAPAPTVTSITPNTGANNDNSVEVSISGTNFTTGAGVTLTANGQTTITGTSVVVANSTTITATFDLTGANQATFNVVVTNPDAQAGTLSSGFSVTNVGTLAINSITDNRADYVNSNIPKYSKYELTFDVDNSTATNFFFPYDTTTPTGVTSSTGITVNAVFTSPTGTTYTQPAFYYQDFDYQIKAAHEWIYPTSTYKWKVRYAPTEIGTWTYRLTAQDSSGSVQSANGTFTVVDSDNKGFIKVSDTDSRYFAFDNGTYFPGLGYNMNYDNVDWDDPVLNNTSNFQTMNQNGIQLARIWLSQWSIFGATWNPWYSMHSHSGQVPLAGLTGYNDPTEGNLVTMRVSANDSWFDSCMFLGFEKQAPAVKQNTNYRVQIYYRIGASGITGTSGNYGFVAKVGAWYDNCNETGTGTPVTAYDTSSTDWEYMTGTWNSGSNNWMPYFYLAVENATAGNVYIRSVAIQEDLGGGNYGPNIVSKPSMSHLTYVDQKYSYSFDKVLELAEDNNIYLKTVLLDKSDELAIKLGTDGTYGGVDDVNNFYGEYRTTTAGRWYQEAWWRYAQARWGYSPNIHSWELLNEADPNNTRVYSFADEFGIFMHQFPNSHLVTTSFWTGFPRTAFWNNSSYPNLDYADIHEYDALDMDTTHYYDTAASTYSVSQGYGAYKAGGVTKPVMRGETGFPESQEQAVQSDDEITLDTNGVWLHNYIWGQINDGGLIESYWYDDQHIYGPTDLRSLFKDYYDFIQDLPLDNGNYVDAAATTTASYQRTWGQKDTTNNRAHIWVQNNNHTWCAVVGGISGCPQTWDSSSLTGTVTLTGFTPNSEYNAELWEFDNSVNLTRSTTSVTSSSSGNIVLDVDALASASTTDMGVKISLASVVAAPSVSGISPASGNTSQTAVSFTITGNNLTSGASVKLTSPSNPDINATSESVVSATSLTGIFNLSSAGVGTYSLVVTNPDLQYYTLTNAFTIGYVAPTVSAVSPSSAYNNTTSQSITITGTGFRSGASVALSFSGQPTISASSVTVNSSTSITAIFNINNIATEAYAVTVTNTDTQAGTLTSGFTVSRQSSSNNNSGGSSKKSKSKKKSSKKSSSKSPSGPITLTKVNGANIWAVTEASKPWATYSSGNAQPWFYGTGSVNGTKVEVLTWPGISVCKATVSGGVWGCQPTKPLAAKTHRIDIKYGSKTLPPFNLRVGGYYYQPYVAPKTSTAPKAPASPSKPAAPAPVPVKPATPSPSPFRKFLKSDVLGTSDRRNIFNKTSVTGFIIGAIGVPSIPLLLRVKNKILRKK